MRRTWPSWRSVCVQCRWTVCSGVPPNWCQLVMASRSCRSTAWSRTTKSESTYSRRKSPNSKTTSVLSLSQNISVTHHMAQMTDGNHFVQPTIHFCVFPFCVQVQSVDVAAFNKIWAFARQSTRHLISMAACCFSIAQLPINRYKALQTELECFVYVYYMCEVERKCVHVMKVIWNCLVVIVSHSSWICGVFEDILLSDTMEWCEFCVKIGNQWSLANEQQGCQHLQFYRSIFLITCYNNKWKLLSHCVDFI